MLPFAYSYITLLLNLLSFLLSYSLSKIFLPPFSKTFFSNGARSLSIRCSAIGYANTNWLNSLGVGSECHTITKSVAKKSAIVTHESSNCSCPPQELSIDFPIIPSTVSPSAIEGSIETGSLTKKKKNDGAPFYLGFESGKICPISRSPKAPKMASTTQRSGTSPIKMSLATSIMENTNSPNNQRIPLLQPMKVKLMSNLRWQGFKPRTEVAA